MSKPEALISEYCLCLAMLMLAGCEQRPLDDSKTSIVRNEPGPSYYVHEARLQDGTRCVVSTSNDYRGGAAITCEWRSRGVER